MLTNQETRTLHTYNQIAQDWMAISTKNFWSPEREKFSKYLSAGKILDLGCGGGGDSQWFCSQGYELLGIDISEEMIKLARAACPKGKFLQKSFDDLSFPRADFDGFWAACSLLHTPKGKIKALLAKIKSFLKPGGVGFIAVKEGIGEKMVEWQSSGLERFFAYYSREEFAKMLKASGFEVLETSEKLSGRNKNEMYLIFYVKAN